MKYVKTLMLLLLSAVVFAEAEAAVGTVTAKKHAQYKNFVVYKAVLPRTSAADSFVVHLGSNGAGIPIWGDPDNYISALFVTPASGSGKDTIGVTVEWQVTGKVKPGTGFSAPEWLTVGSADSLGRASSDAAVFEQASANKGSYPFLRLRVVENGAKSTTTGDLEVYITIPDRVVHAR